MDWVIRSANCPDYWSNELGWVESEKDATVFTQAEKEKFAYIPLSGKWKKLKGGEEHV